MYDVIIIGAGSAGLSARRDVSRFTENYLVIESGPLGTTCARVGCMPSKVLIEAAHIFHQHTKFEKIGASLSSPPKLDGRKLMQHVRSLRDHYVGHVIKDSDAWRDTHLIKGEAHFVSNDTIEAGGKRYQAKKFIVATGSHPTVPPDWRKASGLLTTDEIFEIEDLPKSLIVIGTGAIGLELGHAFSLLGVKVTAIGELKLFANLKDPEIRKVAIASQRRDFEIFDSQVKAILRTSGGYRVQVQDRSFEAEKVLVAIGRTPNLRQLKLEVSGATIDEKGMPAFDPETFRIKGTNAFIAGDVSRLRPLLHEAVDQARAAATNAVSDKDRSFKSRTRLSIIFTHPNIASVGQNRSELEKASRNFVVGHVSFENQGRAVAKLENVGALNVYADHESGKILGAELAAPGGEHLAHLIAWAIESERTVFCLLANPFYHPVLEEGLRTALRDAARQIDNGRDRLMHIRCDEAPAG